MEEAQNKKQQEELQRQQREEQREMIITSICTPQARERLNRVKLVKPEKARTVEDTLLQMAMQRKLGGKVSEDQVISMLGSQESSGPSVKIVRRKSFDSDEEDLEGL